MRHVLLVCLMAVFLVGVGIRSQTTPVEVYFQFAVVLTLGVFLGYAILLGAGAGRSPGSVSSRLLRLSLGVWAVALLIVGYGMLISIAGGWDTRLGLALAVRYTPFLLLPVFVAALRRREDWLRAMGVFIALGTASAVVDLSSIDLLDTHLKRLVSGDFYNAYHQYALVLAILMLGVGAVRGRLGKAALVAAIPVLAWRTLLSLSRGPVVLAVLAVVYAVLMSTRLGPRVLLRRAAYTMVAGAMLWIPLNDLSRTRVADAYEVAFSARASFTLWAIQYRIEELKAALSYGGLTGEGWGSSGDFSSALNFTTSAHALAAKSYVHNLFGFAWWKLGIVGGMVVIGLLVFVIVNIRRSLEEDDNVGLVMGGLLLLWFVHGMVNMDFVRAELNLVIVGAVAYFFASERWSSQFHESRQPLLLVARRPAPAFVPQGLTRRLTLDRA